MAQSEFYHALGHAMLDWQEANPDHPLYALVDSTINYLLFEARWTSEVEET